MSSALLLSEASNGFASRAEKVLFLAIIDCSVVAENTVEL